MPKRHRATAHLSLAPQLHGGGGYTVLKPLL